METQVKNRKEFVESIDTMKVGETRDVRFTLSTKSVYKMEEDKFCITCMVDGWMDAYVNKEELVRAMNDWKFFMSLDWE